MKKLKLLLNIFCFYMVGISAFAQTPVEVNGRLSVVGTKLVNQYGNPVQLRGMSTHGIQWYGLNDCLTDASLDVLAYDWGSDILRISLYVQEGGWETDKAGYEAQVNTLIQKATDRGMYALVDWHQLSPGDPNANTANAKAFFKNICTANADRNNIIYDIANEPNNVTWAKIQDYAMEMIPYLRQYDDDAVILCGTHGWGSLGMSDNWIGSSQDIINDPVTESNFMYTFHFYAKDHQQEYYDEFNSFSDVMPVFVTEWGSQEASGDGVNDFVMAQKYIDLMESKQISWCNWNYSDDQRTGAVWKSGTCSNGPWTVNNLKPAGAWVREKMLSPADNFQGSNNTDPEVSITSPSFGSTFTEGENITITANASDADGNIVSVEFFNGTTSLGTDNSAPYSVSITTVGGTYNLTALATDNDDATTTSEEINITVLVLQSPFGGSAHAIPGTIEAEDYDNGGEGTAYHETSATNEGGATYRNDAVDLEAIDGGFGVGYITAGEWLEYTVDVETSGKYTIDLSVAADVGFGGSFKMMLDDNEIVATTASGTTGGWSVWNDVSISNVDLTQGEHILKFEAVVGDFNLDKLTFTEEPILALFDKELNNALSMYPNPTNDQVNIVSDTYIELGTVQVVSIDGRIVYETELHNQNTLQIDLSEIEKGTYMCVIATEKATTQMKFVKH